MEAKKRGRPAGSKNKITPSGGLEVIKFEKQISNTPINKTSSQGFRNWGLRNDFPNLLLNLYAESPTHAACINFGVQSIVGEGVDYEASNFDGNEIRPNYYQNWDELIRSIALDYMLYGSYAVQVIMNKDGKTLSYFHIPLDRVRWGEYDEDGQITEYYISADWTALGQNPPIKIDAFDMRPDTIIKKGKPYLYVYRPYSPLTTYYTQPHYSPAIKAIQSECEFLNYDLKHIINGFTATGILTLPEVSTDEEKKAIINNIQSMFQGSDQANSLAITFRTSVESSPVEYTPFTTPTSNVNLYADSNQRCINRILSAHQINDPQLIGLPNQGGTGFNSEGQLLETAYNVYNKVVGNYNRQCVIKTFNFMLALNGVDTEIVMKPLRFILDDTKSSDTSKNNVNIDENINTEDKVEEKVDGSGTKE